LSTSLKKRHQDAEQDRIQKAAQRVHRNLKSVRVRFGKGNNVRLIPTRAELKESAAEHLAASAAAESSGGRHRNRTLRKKSAKRNRA